ncbi:MAG: Ig domain-containing protein, partial [Chloroflexota bacterium]|nr:Ig domain-containing protein [Chloroflexota bacterium]
MRAPRHFLDAHAPDRRRRHDERGRSMRESRAWLIGRGIVIGLCAVACIVALSLHTERVAAAGYTVATTSGSGPGSLLDAIKQVNAGAGTGDTITITATGTITPAIALPEILNPVAITGPGAALLTVSGGNAMQVFFVGSGVTASISNLTIANGNPKNVANGDGGGIRNDGTLTVTNSTLSGNSAVLFSASGGYGGGIENGNGTLTLTNSTLTGNSASSFDGGGIETFGTSNLTNTIVAGNTAAGNGPDINGAVVSHGHNLIGNTSGGSGFVTSDLQNVNPALGPLASNGGPTQTRALLPGSLAIGAGDSSVCNSTTTPPGAPVGGKDQRGMPRPPTTCSIGAFEPQTITLAPTTLPNATLGTPYSQTITASGGTAPYTFAVTSGTLPPGLTLATNGTLSGTPTSAGSFTFTVTATDHLGATG